MPSVLSPEMLPQEKAAVLVKAYGRGVTRRRRAAAFQRRADASVAQGTLRGRPRVLSHSALSLPPQPLDQSISTVQFETAL